MDKRLITADLLIKRKVARALAAEREAEQLAALYVSLNTPALCQEMRQAKARAAAYERRARE